jgi:putative MATE family efflux protein
MPAVGEQALNSAVGLADIYLVGNLSAQAAAALGYSSAQAVAGTGLGNQMMWIMMVLFMAVGIGSTAHIARTSGAGDMVGMQRFLRQAMLIGLATGALAMALVLLLAHRFLLTIGAPPGVLPRSEEYLHVLALSLIPTGLLMVGMACMRGVGDTRTPMFIMLGVNGSNVFITWLLVNGQAGLPALGVTGAAIGTAVTRGGGGLLVLGMLLRGCSGLRLVPDVRPDFGRMWRILRVGLPTAGELLTFHGALLIFVHFVTGLGTAAYAAHVTTISLGSLSFMPGMGYANAAGALVGQSLGARSPDRAEAYAAEALRQGVLMMGIAGLLMLAFPAWLLALFVNDPAVIAVGITPVQANGIIQPVLAVSFILDGTLRGAGDTLWPLYTRTFSTWGVRLPLTFLLINVLGFGLNGIWLAMLIDFSIRAVLACWRVGINRSLWRVGEI